jgi:IS30 family transposase
MANRLKMAEHQAILGLVRLKWSYRRIAKELGVHRQTVSRHVRAGLHDPPGAASADSNAAISIAGSATPALDGLSLGYRGTRDEQRSLE